MQPFYYIADKDTLAEEVIHGMRPSLSADLRPKTTKRHLSGDTLALMKSCWDAKAKNRATMDDIINGLATLCETLPSMLWGLYASEHVLTYFPERGSVQSAQSRGSSVGSLESDHIFTQDTFRTNAYGEQALPPLSYLLK